MQRSYVIVMELRMKTMFSIHEVLVLITEIIIKEPKSSEVLEYYFIKTKRQSSYYYHGKSIIYMFPWTPSYFERVGTEFMQTTHPFPNAQAFSSSKA